MEGHHNVGLTSRRDASLQNMDDVRVPGQLAHCPLFAQKSRDLLIIDGGNEHFDGNGAVECRLVAFVDDTETAAADFLGVFEPGGI
jgi:hypothetical protein